MTYPFLGYFVTAAYLLAVVLIGWRGQSLARDSDMFNIFGRRAKSIRATAGYLGLVGGGELITITQLGYSNGWGVLWFLGGVSIGLASLAFIAKRLKSIADIRKINTLAGFYADQYGVFAGYAATIIFCLSLGSLLTLQFIVGSNLLASLLGLPAWLSILLMGGILTSYLVPAGIVAVLSTDVLRTFMMSLVLIVIVVVAVTSLQGDAFVQRAVDPMPQPDGVIYFILGFFGAVAAADVWQTIFASKSNEVLRSSLLSAAAAFTAIGSLLAVLGMITRILVPELQVGETAFVIAATKVVPEYLAPFVAVLVAGSVMATADTEIWVLSTVLISNFRPTSADEGAGQSVASTQLKRATRVVIPVVTGLAMLAAYLSADAQAIYTGLLSLLSASGVAILVAIFGRPSSRSVTWSLWGGLLSYLLLSLFYSFDIPIVLTLVPLAVAAGGFLIGAAQKKSFTTE